MTPGSIGGAAQARRTPAACRPGGKFSEQVWGRGISSERQQAGASHGLITRLDQLAARPGYQLTYSVGWELGARERAAIRLVPGGAALWVHGGGAGEGEYRSAALSQCPDLGSAPVTNGLAKQDERRS